MLLGCFVPCRWAGATTTTYSAPTGAFTIGVGDAAVLINGADITGNVLNDGTLQFDLSTDLMVSNEISGAGVVILTNTGTITFSGSNSYLNGTTVNYGELVITGGGVVDHSAAAMTIGSLVGDRGTLSVAGGTVTDSDGILGLDAGSAGTAFVTSGTWANTVNLFIGESGTGAVTISGGTVTVGGNTVLGSGTGSSGALIVSGGTLNAGSDLKIGLGGDGTMLVDGGYVVDGNGVIGDSATSSGTATITSGTWFNTGSLTVGQAGVGTLNISGGGGGAGVVVVGGALNRGALGSINLDAAGTLIIGTGSSTGTLATDLTNDGTLIFDRFNDSAYGGVIDGTGVVIKRGAGRLLFTGSNTYSGGTEILDGRIDVTSGGAIVHPLATLSIGTSSGAIGGLDVSGGVVNTSLLDIANGDMNLASGLVESGTARVGVFGTGTATFGGGNFTIVDSLFVGYSGTGTMDVNGGNVLSTEAILGSLSGDYGEVSVSNGSVWTNFGNLTVGGAGTAVLNISGDGSVLVTGTLSKGGSGTINLDTNGTLRIGNGGATGELATDLTNNGTLFFNRSTPYTYADSIDGSGAVTKLGTNALTFSGTSSYTGATTIEGGSFYVNGQLGYTAVTVAPGAILGGSGSMLGEVTIGGVSGTAVLSPGSPGDPYAILSSGSLTLAAGSLTQLSVSGTNAGLDYDQIAGIGSPSPLVYGGELEITLSGSYADGTTFRLFRDFTDRSGDFSKITLKADGYYNLISGTFSILESANAWVSNWTTNHQRLEFRTLTGDLIVVPEPATIVLGAVGLGIGGLMRWRRGRRRAAAVETASTSVAQVSV